MCSETRKNQGDRRNWGRRRYKRKDVFFFYPGKMLGLTGELSQGVLCCWHLHFPCSKFAGMRSELAGGAEAVIPGWEETFIIHSVWKSLLDAAVNCSSAQKVIKVNIWQQLLQCYVEKSPMLPGIKRQDKFKVKFFFLMKRVWALNLLPRHVTWGSPWNWCCV